MKRFILVMLSLVLSLGFAQQQVEGLDTSPGETAAIRVAHLAAGAANVDVYINDTNAISGVMFRDVSEYYIVPAGEVEIRITGAGQIGEEDALIEASLEVEAGVYYTIAALGSGEDIEARVYRDNLRAFPPANGASVRVLHAARDAEAVDIAVRDGDTLVEDLEFGQVSEYFFVPADTYDLDIREAGAEDAAMSQEGLELRVGHIYTIFAIAGGQQMGMQEGAQAAPATATATDATATETAAGAHDLELIVVIDARIVSEAADAQDVGTAVAQPAPIEEAEVAEPEAPAVEEVEEAEPAEPVTEEEEVTEPEEPEPTEPEEPVGEEEEVAEPEAPAPADEEMVATGTLEIILEQPGVTVVITGPDGFQQNVTGSQTLTGLLPGNYILMATGEGYQPVQEEVELEEGETATVTLELEEETD